MGWLPYLELEGEVRGEEVRVFDVGPKLDLGLLRVWNTASPKWTFVFASYLDLTLLLPKGDRLVFIGKKDRAVYYNGNIYSLPSRDKHCKILPHHIEIQF